MGVLKKIKILRCKLIFSLNKRLSIGKNSRHNFLDPQQTNNW